MNQISLVKSIFKRIDWAGEILGVSRDIIENELKHFKYSELTADKIRVELDDGSYGSFTAIASLHCLPYPANMPYKGGMRISHVVTPDILRALAIEMTLKCGVTDLEFGGAKSGILLPKPMNQYSPQEISRIVEAVAEIFIEELPIINPHLYVPATDIGSNSEHMDLIYNKFRELSHGQYEGTPVTGQSLEYGGLPVRRNATGLGGFVVLEQLRKLEKLPKINDEPTIIVQGTGQVGTGFLRLVCENGYKIVGICNASNAIYNPKGIPAKLIPTEREATFSKIDGESFDPKQLLEKPCDILVPAAIENVLTIENAKRIKAKAILELANHPTTNEADSVLTKRGIYIIPDILANSGGVAASFKEWSNSFGAPRHKIEIPKIDEEVKTQVIEVIKDSTNQVMDYAKKYNTSLRGGAWLKAIDVIVKALAHKHRRWIK